MYDLLFANQKEWSNAADPMKSIFPAYAGRIGLDMERFNQDMADASLDDKINRDRDTGNELKITGTPTFFLNGQKMENPKSFEALKKSVQDQVK
jgi:protein-disulfide isomerase